MIPLRDSFILKSFIHRYVIHHSFIHSFPGSRALRQLRGQRMLQRRISRYIRAQGGGFRRPSVALALRVLAFARPYALP